jgi:hypothetical protein
MGELWRHTNDVDSDTLVVNKKNNHGNAKPNTKSNLAARKCVENLLSANPVPL